MACDGSLNGMIFQLCTGIEEKSMGSCFQLVFAPIDELFPDDAPLISSGFRVIPLDIKSVECFLSFLEIRLMV
jgi:homeobox-leucine zipper protein